MRVQSVNLFNGRSKIGNNQYFGSISNRALDYALNGLDKTNETQYNNILKLAAIEHTGKYLDITIDENADKYIVLDKSRVCQGSFETLPEAVEYGEKFVDTAFAKTEIEKIKGMMELAKMLEESRQFNNYTEREELGAAHKLLHGLEVTELYKNFE